MATPAAKPKRIRSILDYLQQDVPKVGDNEESVPGEEMTDMQTPPDLLADPSLKKKKRPASAY